VVLAVVDVEWIPFDEHHDHYWTTDSSGWYFQGSCGVGYDHKRLDRFEVVELGEEPEDFQWKPGILMVDESKNGYCPWCGALLAGGAN
jgi:hypothetical protein